MAANSGPCGGVHDEIHPDFDRSDEGDNVRLVALALDCWRFQRGRGPRNDDLCNFCRGTLTDTTEIFVHENRKCRNAWPVCCLLGMLDQQLVIDFGFVRCPKCSLVLFNTHCIDEFMLTKEDGPTAVLRVTLFSPEFVLQCGFQERRPIIFMEREQMKSVTMFQDEAKLFSDCSDIKREGESQRITVGTQMTAPGTLSPVFNAWVLIGFRYNIFRMCTFLPQQMEELRSELVAGGANVRLMSAESFNAEAELRGGLTTTLDGILAGELDRNLEETEKVAEEFMCGSEGARELWAESSYLHLFKTFVAAKRGTKEIKNPRYKAFLESISPKSVAYYMAQMMGQTMADEWTTSGQEPSEQWPIAEPGHSGLGSMDVNYSLSNSNTAQHDHFDDDEGMWEDEPDDDEDFGDYDDEDDEGDGDGDGDGGAQGVENDAT